MIKPCTKYTIDIIIANQQRIRRNQKSSNYILQYVVFGFGLLLNWSAALYLKKQTKIMMHYIVKYIYIHGRTTTMKNQKALNLS